MDTSRNYLFSRRTAVVEKLNYVSTCSELSVLRYALGQLDEVEAMLVAENINEYVKTRISELQSKEDITSFDIGAMFELKDYISTFNTD